MKKTVNLFSCFCVLAMSYSIIFGIVTHTFTQDYEGELSYYQEETDDINETIEFEDTQSYEYSDNVTEQDDSVPLEESQEAVDTKDSNQTIDLSLFKTYKPPITVDPSNPNLPQNHQLIKLRGTVWRGSDRILRTNSRGVVGEYRSYIFFDKDRDALAYRYLPYNTGSLPNFPFYKDFIPLAPLLKTNNYIPVLANKAQANNKSNNISYSIDKKLDRNYDYKNALDKITQDTNYVSWKKDDIIVFTNRITDFCNTCLESKPETSEIIQVVTNKVLNIVTNITAIDATGQPRVYSSDPNYFDDLSKNVQDTFIEPSDEGQFDIKPIPSMFRNSSLQNKGENYFNTDEFVNPEDLYDIYSKKELDNFQMIPMSLVAQNLKEIGLDPGRYIINIGGQNSAIIVFETGNPNAPYKIILLSLDGAANLYEYNTESNIDIRDALANNAQKVRESYIKVLEEKKNMKKYQQVVYQKDILD